MLIGKNICKNYGDLSILKHINISVERGEIVALIGPSGAGKSTLLHILGLIDTPSSGEVWFNHERLDHLSDRKLNHIRNQKIGFIFQAYHLLPEFTALENICMPAWIAKKNDSEVKVSAFALLEQLGLMDRAYHKPRDLSGGEQQRVAVARALINKPDIILADEPSGNLDSNNAQALHLLFEELNKTIKQTFLIVTHNENIMQKCHRVLKMQDGCLVAL